jgi:ATP-dependent DNA helicase RecG
MRDFFQQSERIYFDESPCTDFKSLDDLDTNAFNTFLTKAHISNSLDQDTLLENLKLITEDRKLKNGAVLFFGKSVQVHFEKAVVRCIQYKGLDKRFIIDDKIVSGNLLQQYDEAIRYVLSKLNLSYEIESQGTGPRKEILEIPEIVFKEALVNALTHRDYYDKGAATMVEVFDDRIEITNPGGLVNGIPRDQFGKRSLSRNPLIFGLFERINMVEQVGSGIGRIKEAMKETGLPEPIFSVEGMFSVIIQRPVNFDLWIESWKNKLNETRVTMLRLFHKTPEISKKELSGQLGISSTAIDKNLFFLKQLNLIEREGPDKGGKWKIIFKKVD